MTAERQRDRGGTIRERLLDVALVVVVTCAVLMTVITVRDHLGASAAPTSGRQPPEFIEDWEALGRSGHRIGPDNAPVTVIVFSDFECPMCGQFATRTYPEFRDRHPGMVALVYRHWPLPQHRYAYPAARASECAAAQGRFWDFHDHLYAEQSRLGIKTFSQFAFDAGVPNIKAFDACVTKTDPVPAVEADVREVRELGGTGTPTVVVNGWLLRGGVDVRLLDSIARPFFPRSR